MILRLFIVALLSTMLAACHHHEGEAGHDGHDHAANSDHSHAHQSPGGGEDHAEHEEAKFQYTAYSHDFELFAEADPFVVGEMANVLAHFSVLPDFTALLSGSIKLILDINGQETIQVLDKPARKGIYSFDIKPETPGTGTLRFEIANAQGTFDVIVAGVRVFSDHHQAHEVAEALEIQKTNTTVFTKEQSWKIDFSTTLPLRTPLGEVIKTTALVQASKGSETLIPAGAAGIVHITDNSLLEGKVLTNGQLLCSISTSNMADNNMAVRLAEAESNFNKAKADYERAQVLAKDRIVSEKDLIAARNQYENSRAVYENLNRSFSAGGQRIVSPMDGYIKRFFVENGMYVEAGQVLFTVSQNRRLTLSADLPIKYAPVLGNIQTANIRIPESDSVYTLESLKGKVLGYGKSTGTASHLIPIALEVENNGAFIPGSLVEVFFKTTARADALTVPLTALIEEQGSFFVWVQLSPELFEKRAVSTGKTDGQYMEIVKGLRPEERIVSRGAMMIKLAQATGSLDAHSGHVH